MKGKWKEYLVEDFADVVGGGTPSTKDALNFGGDIPWLTPKDLSGYQFRFIKNGERNITEKGFKESNATLLPAGTVLLTSRAPVGYLAIAANPITTNQGFKSLIVHEGFDNVFVYYLLKNNVEYLKSNASGTTFGELSGSTLKKLSFSIPDYPTQQKIASILGALDDKIELNRRMNKTLEEIARAIFRHWFVDNPEVENWRLVELDHIAEIIDCLHSKKPTRQERGKPLLQLWNILDNGMIDISNTFWISEDDYKKWITRIEASPGDCVITNVGRVAAIAQIPIGLKAALGRNMTAIRCKQDFPYPTFLLECLRSDSMRQEITQKTDIGTILDALNVRNISKLRFRLPDEKSLVRFENSVKPIRLLMEHLLMESRSLASIRDLLIPKLLRGDIIL